MTECYFFINHSKVGECNRIGIGLQKIIHLDKAGIQQVSRIEEMNTFPGEGLKTLP